MIKVSGSILGHDIAITAEQIGDEWNLSITGGEVPHVGCVSLAWIEADTMKVDSIIRPGHMDYVVGEKLAVSVAKATETAASVSSGIHYDNLSKEQIGLVVELTDNMIAQLIGQITSLR